MLHTALLMPEKLTSVRSKTEFPEDKINLGDAFIVVMFRLKVIRVVGGLDDSRLDVLLLRGLEGAT